MGCGRQLALWGGSTSERSGAGMQRNTSSVAAALLKASAFAAGKHRDQRRKGAEASPYINHAIAVAEVLACAGQVDKIEVLQAALLHDTIEDTETSPEEIEREFGPDVRALVEEVTDDKTLPKKERKRLQVEHAPHLSFGAKLIKLADKICNVRDMVYAPPEGWDQSRRDEYVEWAARVVAGCRGNNRALDERFDALVKEARRGS